jgi:hypothetical protein
MASCEERYKYLKQGRSDRRLPVVTVYRGGMYVSWLDGRAYVRGFGRTEKESVNALKGLLS